jgi:hypothetical protein
MKGQDRSSMRKTNKGIVIRSAGHAFILLLLVPAYLSAQEVINKEVVVVKPYEPILNDAFKINLMPDLKDSAVLAPDFDYHITSRPLIGEYAIRPIQAAKMEAEPLSELYNTYVKVGFGNYITPMLQLGLNSLREKNYTAGLLVSHMSSQGKVTLDNDQKVFAGYSDTDAKLFGKRIMKKSVLTGDVGFGTNTRYFYGYYTGLDTVVEFEKADIKQRYLGFNTKLCLASMQLDSSRLNYSFQAGFGYYQDFFSHHEEEYSITGTASKMFARGYFGLDTRIHHFSKSANLDSNDVTLVSLAPWWTKSTSQYRLRLGLDITTRVAGETRIHFYPNAMMQFKAVENIIMPYIGVAGYLEENNFQKIAEENYFITPGLSVKNSDHKMEFFSGIKGNFSTKTAFTLKASYSLIDDMYFFVNDSSLEFNNQFTVMYDDAEIMNYYGEFTVYPTEKMSFILKGNYYTYTLGTGDKPWHKPLYDISFSARYNLRNKILVGADVQYIGTRYAKSYNPAVKEIKMKGFADINLRMEYRYTKILSGFIDIHNLASSRYMLWNQYPAQRFFLMVGFTYSM